MVDRFFLPAGFEPVTGASVELEPEEHDHALKSRRVTAGQRVELLDGKGSIASGTVTVASKHALEIAIESVERHPRAGRWVHLAVSVPKGPRMDDLVDALTQLGVASITPIQTERSVAAREELSPKRVARWERIAREASKQARQPFLPAFGRLVAFADFAAARFEGQRFLLHPAHESSKEPGLAELLRSAPGAVRIAIGPEGGFTDREVDLARERGETIASLGGGLLRIELAALAAAVLARMLHS